MLSHVAERTTLRSSRARRAQSVACVLLALALGCHRRVEAPTEDSSRADLGRVLDGDETIARDAARRLSAAGAAAVPLVTRTLAEAKTTSEQRARLIGVLSHMKDAGGDAAPLLGQIVQHDADGLVRSEAEWTLKHWAAETSDRASRARAELRLIDAARDRTLPG